MKTLDIRVPLLLLIVIISLLAFCKSAPAAPLNAEQKALVSALTANNKEMTAKIAEMDAQIASDAAKQVFATQKIESLTANLITAKQTEEAQFQDLLSQQTKIHALESDRDKQVLRAETAEKTSAKKTAEAHRNAVERDICLWSLALAVTILVLTCAGQIIGWIVRVLPAAAPYGALIEIGLAVGTFFGTYTAGRVIIRIICSHL